MKKIKNFIIINILSWITKYIFFIYFIMILIIFILIFHEYNSLKCFVKYIINKKLILDAFLSWVISYIINAISGDKSKYHQETGISDDQELDSVSWPLLSSHESSSTSISTPWPRSEQNFFAFTIFNDGNDNNAQLFFFIICLIY